MALIVEDGTGVANANAYVIATFVDGYFSDRGISAWTGSTIVKEQSIIRATDYIEQRWGPFFNGIIEFPDLPQVLSFPRVQLADRNGLSVTGIPTNLKYANCEYALRALTADLMPDPTLDSSGLQMSEKSEKTGPLEESVKYVGSSYNTITVRPYPQADAYLRDYVSTRSRVIR